MIKKAKPSKKSEADKRPILELEEQLASVVEREGLVFQTPLGPKRGRRQEKSWKPSLPSPTSHADCPALVPEKEPAVDEVLRLDQMAVGLVVKIPPGFKDKSVQIKRQEHVRSPYVVSLQKVAVRRQSAARERQRVTSEAFGRDESFQRPVEVYATLTHDLSSQSLHPWATADQFTPDDFATSFRSVYGRFDWLTSLISEFKITATSLFQDVERVEKDTVQAIEEAVEEMPPMRFSPLRAMAGFAALVVLVTLPASAAMLYKSASANKTQAASAGTQAVAELAQVGSANLPQTAEALRRASAGFRDADNLLGQTNALAVGLASFLPNQYRSARALLEVGDKTTSAARLLALGFGKVFSDQGRKLDERLEVMGAYAKTAQGLLADASKAAATVDSTSLPTDQQEQVQTLLGQLDKSQTAVRELTLLADALAKFSGRDRSRRYLLIFQNQTEIRPTGGFMGSFAEVTLDHGAIKSVSVPGGGTYHLKGQLLARVIPPQPLQLINPLWQFQDANWFPDFPESARKINWFWSKSGQPTVDGIIAVNASFMEKLLSVTGPIAMPEYGKVVTAENFLLETQKAVELEYDRQENEPKKFVGDLMDRLMEQVKSFGQDDWLKVAALVAESLETKDVQLAFFDPEEEVLAERFGWSGRLKPSVGDSLALIEANVAGQKTDGVVEETVEHEVHISADGSIEDFVTLKRRHLGIKGELFRGVRNVVYLRTYVPAGSRLVAASGFEAPGPQLFKKINLDDQLDPDIALIEDTQQTTADGVNISREKDRTVFGGWLQLDPGQSQTVTLRYRLPFTVSDILAKLDTGQVPDGQNPRGAYLLLLTSQSGKTARNLTSKIILPESWRIAWTKDGDQSLSYSGVWDRDRVMAALLTPAHAPEIQ